MVYSSSSLGGCIKTVVVNSGLILVYKYNT